MSGSDDDRERMEPRKWQATASWVPPREPEPRATLTRRELKIQERNQAKEEIARLRSLRPIPLIRSKRHLERGRRRLESRVRQLDEEIGLLGGE